jgi:hypothetical protein
MFRRMAGLAVAAAIGYMMFEIGNSTDGIWVSDKTKARDGSPACWG